MELMRGESRNEIKKRNMIKWGNVALTSVMYVEVAERGSLFSYHEKLMQTNIQKRKVVIHINLNCLVSCLVAFKEISHWHPKINKK